MEPQAEERIMQLSVFGAVRAAVLPLVLLTLAVLAPPELKAQADTTDFSATQVNLTGPTANPRLYLIIDDINGSSVTVELWKVVGGTPTLEDTDSIAMGDFRTSTNGTAGNGPIELVGSTALVEFSLGSAGNNSMAASGDYGVVFGMDGDDLVIGGSGIDTIIGGGDDDELSGGDDSDEIWGGSFFDDIDGDDTIWGDTMSTDRAFSGDGDDVIFGGTGEDQIFGNGGHDSIYGEDPEWTNAFNGLDGDEINGGEGNDALFGCAGDDRIYGNEDDDDIFGAIGPATPPVVPNVFTGTGATDEDIIFGGEDDDIIEGEFQFDQINGDEGEDTIGGGDGDDEIYGDDGEDTLAGDDGDDELDGGEGNDTISGDDGADPYSLTVIGADTINGGDDGDTIFGGEGVDIIDGGYGVDVIEGGSDGDFIDGGADTDTLFGESEDYGAFLTAGGTFGNDTLTGGQDSDNLFGQEGDDILIGDDMVNPDIVGDDLLEGGDGDDICFGGPWNDCISVGASGTLGDQAFGGTGEDLIFDDDSNNVTLLEGGDDDDVIACFDGSTNINSVDTVTSGTGNDTVYFDGVDVHTDFSFGADTESGTVHPDASSGWQIMCAIFWANTTAGYRR
jgi:Ca2+-binding RTX toxin-like protein